MTRYALPPDDATVSARWATPAYAEELRARVEPRLGAVELEQVKLRGWSTVWRADGARGRHWVKENCLLNRFEAPLLRTIGSVVPGRVPEVSVLDETTAQFLAPDHGDVLGVEHAEPPVWARLLGEWAQLQRDLLPHEAALVAAGTPSLGPADADALATERAEALHGLPADDPRRLPDEGYAALVAGREVLRRSVDEVAALGLPLALNHNDLHGGNVFADDGGALCFFDLGDAMLTDPAGVLLVPLGILADRLGCAPGDARLWQVAETWVEVWSDLVPATRLREALPHALRLARLARHDSWVRALAAMSEAELADWGDAASYWLGVVPTPTPLEAA